MDVRVVAQLGAQCFGKAALPEFAGAVRRRKWRGCKAARRDHVDEDAVALIDEDGDHRMGVVHATEQVGVDHGRARFHRYLMEFADCAHPDIAEPQVDAPQKTLRAGRQCLDLFGMFDVGGHHQDLGTSRTAAFGNRIEGVFARAASTRRAPCSANASAVAWPMPLDAPEITTWAGGCDAWDVSTRTSRHA